MFRKRRFPRVDEQWELKFEAINADRFEKSPVASLALNISGGGLCFVAEEPLAKGTMLAIDMQSPDFDSPVVALAKVVWCTRQRGEDGHEIGAEFWWVGWKDDDAQARITDYIKAKAEAEAE